MDRESIFMSRGVDHRAFNQSGNFDQEATSEDEVKTILGKIKLPSNSQKFLSLCSTEKPSTSATTPNSPAINRKDADGGNKDHDNNKSHNWFQSQLINAFSERNLARTFPSKPNSSNNTLSCGTNSIPKSNSYKNITNFDLNAIGPTSF